MGDPTESSGLSEPTLRLVDTASTGGITPSGPRSQDLPFLLLSEEMATLGLSTNLAISISMMERNGSIDQEKPLMLVPTVTQSLFLELTADSTDSTITLRDGPELLQDLVSIDLPLARTVQFTALESPVLATASGIRPMHE